MKAFVLVLTSIFFAPIVSAQQDTTASAAEKIKILSWNIYMLPGFLGPGKMLRAEAIGNILASSDYDVIVSQEAFHKKTRNIISRLLQPAFPFQSGPSQGQSLSLRVNSGLWIVSRYPIKEVHSIIFKAHHGVDALSRKGALMVTVKVNTQSVQIVGTHLQNGGKEWRRENQCTELFQKLLKKFQEPGVPQIVCGDFNIDRHSLEPHYLGMLQTLNANDRGATDDNIYSCDGLLNDLRKESGNRRDLIDYILIRENLAWVDSGDRKVRIFQHRWHSLHQDLSDHYSLEAVVRFRNSKAVYVASSHR